MRPSTMRAFPRSYSPRNPPKHKQSRHMYDSFSFVSKKAFWEVHNSSHNSLLTDSLMDLLTDGDDEGGDDDDDDHDEHHLLYD